MTRPAQRSFTTCLPESTLLKLCAGLGISSTDLLGDLAPLPAKRKSPGHRSRQGEGAPT